MAYFLHQKYRNIGIEAPYHFYVNALFLFFLVTIFINGGHNMGVWNGHNKYRNFKDLPNEDIIDTKAIQFRVTNGGKLNVLVDRCCRSAEL